MKIMIVDDDVSVLKTLKDALTLQDYQTIGFDSPVEALQAYRQSPCEVVILDVCMPKMDGISLMEEIRDVNPKVRIVIVTGYADVDNAVAALNNGAYRYLRKPIGISELNDILLHLQDEIDKGLAVAARDVELKQAFGRLTSAYHDPRDFLKSSDDIELKDNDID